ncbi:MULTISPECIES: molybdopterin-dependent oxidoreductase [unclassified Achromobacter]|uniref:molybdopterin-dependent oxidoreductase n=1 Tax=unclassified Achromobacter TaxID=2626865 RepID=UPI000B517CF5|nr:MULTISPECIES: molybdopterin-dependent oxidoreductase [unclassified Achromobacter]OWT67359.1 ferredoxin:oxidoreductase FAD/NAD(P)-binding protein [Achromobacter sp. HZ34]OWT67390.1 ferredoxin:oxidoreductase FAD/NAD(P)-binding protein [Achromobacter sp. HZ28]
MGAIEISGYCTLCRSRCGTRNIVDHDALLRVVPDTAHPTGQAMCMKGRAAPELVHSPHRILHPMRRTRPKGDADPGWERISWEEALTLVAARLGEIRDQSGPEAVAFSVTTPSGTPLSDSIDWIERFVRAFGSPNICYATEICNWHKDFAHAFTYGSGMPVADYSGAGLILLWGHNPTNTWLAQANAIGVGRARGARLMVVDPRRTALAGQADAWLPVRPGTDAALALGLIHQLLDTQRYDAAFVREWTNAPLLVRVDTGHFLRAEDVAWDDVPCGKSAGAVAGAGPRAGFTAPDEAASDDVASDAASGTTNESTPTPVFVAWRGDLDGPAPYDTRLAAADQGGAHYALSGAYDIPLHDGRGVRCLPVLALLAREASAYTPARVAEITSVPPETLLAAADLLATSGPVAYHAWTGIGQHSNATQTERAVAVLHALTGSFDVPGGNRQYARHAVNKVNGLDLISPAQSAKALGLAERPLGPPANGWVTARDLYKAILEGQPYPVRALFGFGSNPLASQGDVEMAEAALRALEFHVHLDLFETPSARYADVLLPVNTPWEREGLRVGFEINQAAESRIQLRPRMVTPRGESRSDNDIVFDLACRLGMGNLFFDGSLERGWDHILAPLGIRVADLRAAGGTLSPALRGSDRKYALPDAAGPDRPRRAGWPLAGATAVPRAQPVTGFATETRRVELYSERLLRHGYAPMPVHAASPAEAGGSQYPLVLTSAKSGYYCHSQHRSLVSLRKRAPLPRAALGRGLAARKGIVDGDWVRLATPVGQARFVALVDDDLNDDVVVADYGWWQPCPEIGQEGYAVRAPGGVSGSNYNALITAAQADPVSGSVPMRAFPCDLERDASVDPQRRSWTGTRAFVVSHLYPRTRDVLEITFTAADGGTLPDYQPGQHVTIEVAAGPAEKLLRAYSLVGSAISPATSPRREYRVAVRRQYGTGTDGAAWHGRMSGHLHKQLRLGDSVRLGAPGGSFIVPTRSPKPLVCFAAGIGITPFIAHLETLAAQAQEAGASRELPEVWLHYANRNGRHHAYAERLAELRARLPRLTIVDYYAHPLPEDGRGARRLDAACVDDSLLRRRARFYMCGSEAMMRSLTEDLIARGVPAFDIFSEVFRSPPAPVLGGDATHAVRFARSGDVTSTWTSARGTLLSFAESQGLNLPSGCRVGQCESCAVRIVSGQVRHLHGAEPEDPDICLTCQAVPVADLVLDA